MNIFESANNGVLTDQCQLPNQIPRCCLQNEDDADASVAGEAGDGCTNDVWESLNDGCTSAVWKSAMAQSHKKRDRKQTTLTQFEYASELSRTEQQAAEERFAGDCAIKVSQVSTCVYLCPRLIVIASEHVSN